MTRQPHHAHLDAMQASVDTARLDAGEMTLAEWAKRGERRLLVAAGAVREDRPRDATAELLREIRSRLPVACTEGSGVNGSAAIRYFVWRWGSPARDPRGCAWHRPWVGGEVRRG